VPIRVSFAAPLPCYADQPGYNEIGRTNNYLSILQRRAHVEGIVMAEWNILATAYWGREKNALRFLTRHGEFRSSGFKDVIRGHVEDIDLFLEKIETMRQENPGRINFISQIIPLERTFHFDLSDFMDKLKQTVSPYLEKVEGKRFYVRVKRRGHKGELSSQEIEKEISGFILESLEKAGKPAHVGFDDPDAIIVVETIADWAGVGWVSRDMKERYLLVKIK